MAPFPSPTKIWHDNTYPTLSPTRPELSAKGKTIIITGGGTGIGAETARSFAQAGATRIALLGRREQPLLDTKASILGAHPTAEVFTASMDMTSQPQVEQAFAAISQAWAGAKIDVLVSNAGYTGSVDPVRNVDVDAFMTAVDINLRGALNVAQAFLKYAASDAVVIQTNTSAAHVNFGAAFPAYSVAKWAVFRMWDSLGFANPSVRVYNVQPGVVDTDMNREAGGVKAMGFEDHVSLPATFNVWLASPEAKFLKGKFLWANWDVDELKAREKELENSATFNLAMVGWPFGGSEYEFKPSEGISGDSAFLKK